MSARVLVDQKEYAALCELRDGVYESLRARHEALKIDYEVLKGALERAAQGLEVANVTARHLGERNAQQHALLLQMQKRLAELEPVRISTPQPAFRK